MATVDQIADLREMLGETDTDNALFAEDRFVAWIDGSPSLEEAALRGWRAKAAQYANLVNVSDGASSRAFSDLLVNAQAMVKMYAGIVEGPTLGRARVGRIVRDE